MKPYVRVLVTAVFLLGLFAVPFQQAQTVKAQSRGAKNPLGILVVRFRPGLTPAQMRDAVTTAGGEITNDLTRINAVAAVPAAADFRTRIARNPNVRTVFEDKFSVRIPRPDVSTEVQGTDRSPQFGSPGEDTPPDPWHDAADFIGETNPESIMQWDDNRMNVRDAWETTTGDESIRVAVLDTGVQGSHRELLANYDNQTSTSTIPCNILVRQYGPLGQMDCSTEDTEGHGTWVASRIAGAVNGFASNGVAPDVTIIGIKVLSTTLGGGLTSWIAAGMVHACMNDVDLINMSLGGYDHPTSDADDYLLWVDAVNFCRSQGVTILASAGNEHVRINKVNLTVGGRALSGVGQVDRTEGYSSVIPGDPLANSDLRGLLETPAGVPGVIMVSATNNAIADASGSGAVNYWTNHVGAQDQLTYYSNYGTRIDITAPGGARKFNIPRYDGGPGDILYGGWGTLGALDASGEICTDAALSSLSSFACFKVTGMGFGWLQGTSMSSPNATGVAALALSAQESLRGNPDDVLQALQSTARKDMVNYMGPNDPNNKSASAFGIACTTGYCHIQLNNPISFSDAYGAGMVNAAAVVEQPEIK